MTEKKNLKYYTAEETAKILKVTVRSIYRFMQEQGLKGYKIGRNWLFTEEDILSFVKGKEVKVKKKEEQ